MSNYPSSKDALPTNASGSDTLGSVAGTTHSALHNNAADAINKIQDWVGLRSELSTGDVGAASIASLLAHTRSTRPTSINASLSGAVKIGKNASLASLTLGDDTAPAVFASTQALTQTDNQTTAPNGYIQLEKLVRIIRRPATWKTGDPPMWDRAIFSKAPYQQSNAVTNFHQWGTNLNVSLDGQDPGDGAPTNGDNIQLEWVPAAKSRWGQNTIRVHVDAPGPDANGVLRPGAATLDLLRAKNAASPAGWGKPTWPVMIHANIEGYTAPTLNLAFTTPQAGFADKASVVAAKNADVLATFAYLAPSAKRYKTVSRARDAVDYTGFLKALSPVVFTYNDTGGSFFAGTKHVGFVAEDVEAKATEHGIPDGIVVKDGGDVESLADRDLIAVLWKVCQDQQARIEALEASLAPPDPTKR